MDVLFSTSVDVDLGFCERCAGEERRRTHGATAMIITGVALIVGGFAFGRIEGAAGLVFVAGGIFFGVRAVEPLHGGYADGRSLWILGADPTYLDALPDLPGDHVPPALVEADKVL